MEVISIESIQFRSALQTILQNNEQFLRANIRQDGIIGIQFASRLLESILLASYFKRYYPETGTGCDKMVLAVAKDMFDQSFAPAPDLNVQERLLSLYLYGDVGSEELERWNLFYQALLQEVLKADDFYNQVRKSIIFNAIALFSCANESNQRLFMKLFQDHFKRLIPCFKTTAKATKQVNWNQTYPYLFALMAPKSEKELTKAIKGLFRIQNADGTWFRHHTLTLLVVHTLRFQQYDKRYPDLVTEGLEKAEGYLRQYLGTGLAVIPSQDVYNTYLYYAMRSLFARQDPPLSLIETILENQDTHGGWQFTANAHFPDSDSSSLALLSLIHWWHETHDPRVGAALTKAMDYIAAVRQENGSFIMYPQATEPLAEMTARGIILAAQLPPEFITQEYRFQIVRGALDWFLEKQCQDGTFECQSYSYSKVYPLSQVALSLFLLEQSPYIAAKPFKAAIEQIRGKITNYLKIAQNLDGSYGSRPSYPYGEQQSTAYAAFTWTLVDPSSEGHMKALHYLISVIEGVAKSYPEGTGPRPIRYNDLAHGPLFVYIAVASSLEILDMNSQLRFSVQNR